MRALRVELPDGRRLAERAWRTESMVERAQGWLTKASVDTGEGLLIVPCGAVHTYGMRFSIDVVFLDRAGQVLKLAPDVAPGRVALGPWLGLLLPWTVQTLELPAGVLAASGLKKGQILNLSDRAA